ncbi:hypothetical protein FHU37_003843 [Allostreptomyces psammosilenae]|uniref:Uncharacterized protein n=1 Tax=Allostreptomyces psammosilenae TaxID=1892865 RepID=A0A853A0B1_9ACTN|nr:hypothetical protein [Allostreptomyces psammosilenae]
MGKFLDPNGHVFEPPAPAPAPPPPSESGADNGGSDEGVER